ncbi:MAG TPA: hypothetical protein VF492_01040 [Verrucomicrobiae bacterium]
MDRIEPYIIPWIGSLIVSFLGGMWVDRRTMRREAETRRRVFRGEIRNVASRITACPNVGLLAAYKQSIQDVSRQCDIVLDDIRCWRRSNFRRCRAKYCGFKDEDIDPSKRRDLRDPTIPDDKRKRAWQEARKRLGDALVEFEKYAK